MLRSPPSLDLVALVALKRSSPANFLPASAQQHKRQKTITSGAKTVSRGMPAEVESEDESVGSSTEESDEDHRPPPSQLRSPPKPYQSSPPPGDGRVKDEPPSTRSSTTPKPARVDDPLREAAEAVMAVVKNVPMVSQTGRKMPVGFYFSQTGVPKSPDQPAGGRELQPVSQARVLLLNQTGAMTGPSSASRRAREDSKNEDRKYEWESKPNITRTDSHASSASFWVPRTSPELHQQFHEGLQMLNRPQQDSETESWRSTQQDGEGSTVSSQDDSGQSVQRFDPSVRTGQEFKCPVLPVPMIASPRSRSPRLSPMGQKALDLHPHPQAMPVAPHPAMRPHPTQDNSDPMLLDEATFSQSQSFVYHPPAPPSQASSNGDATSAASSSQPFPFPPTFVVTEAAAAVAAAEATAEEMAAPPVPRQQRSASDGAAGEGDGAGGGAGGRKKGKPLKRTSGDDLYGAPAPLSRGVSELFPDCESTKLVGVAC